MSHTNRSNCIEVLVGRPHTPKCNARSDEMTNYRLLNRNKTRRALITACIVAVAGALLAGTQTSSTSQPPTSAGPVDPKLVEDLVAAYRILADQGILDAMGHVSVRHNRNPNRFLMSRAVAPELVTVDDIMEFDLDSNPG